MAKKIARNAKYERDPGTTRRNREMDSRSVTENRELTDSQRLDAFRTTFFQSALPDLPRIPGWHVCWLTTTNPRDPIHARMRLGYEPIKDSDIPGWEHASIKSGEWTGCIGVNEMIAFKLPLHLYEAFMTEAHYNQPLNEEEKLTIAAKMIAEQAAGGTKSGRAPLIPEPGQADIGGFTPPVPIFAEAAGDIDPEE